MSATDFTPLVITSLTPATADAVTVGFRPPATGGAEWNYRAGQYVTLRFVIDGKEERRAYSMSSAPFEGEIAVTVKRVKGGIVSNHIADHLKVGDTVDVMPPQGRFLAETDGTARRDFYLFGAGSGITPLMSILKTVLEEEPKSRVHLLYGNRNEDSIIFHAELAEIVRRYEGQVTVEHTLSRPKKVKTGGLRGLFGGGKTTWEGAKGRIGIPAVQRFLDARPPAATERQYYVCGPGKMIDDVEQALLGMGIHKDFIHTERFVSANDVKDAPPVEGEVRNAVVKATVSGKEHAVTLKPGQTILDGLLEAGAQPAYSCLAGACSTCMAKVTKGGVRMEVCFAIDDDEVAEGYILSCQAHPTTPEVEVTFDV